MAFPIDTFIVNKNGGAKLTSTNSLDVSGAALIKSGQCSLAPNDSILYKLVCAGDLKISAGGGMLLGKDAAGRGANIAVAGSIYDDNTVIDSTCTGFNNPYNGNLTLYRSSQSGANTVLNFSANSNIGNLKLIGVPGRILC